MTVKQKKVALAFMWLAILVMFIANPPLGAVAAVIGWYYMTPVLLKKDELRKQKVELRSSRRDRSRHP